MEISEVDNSDDDSLTANSNNKSLPLVHMQWEIAEKRILVAEAKHFGISLTAQRHDMSPSTLRGWMMQDFGDPLGTKKTLSGGGRPLKYVHMHTEYTANIYATRMIKKFKIQKVSRD